MVSITSPETILFLYALIVAAGIILILKLSKDKTRKISTLRLFIQIVAVIAVFMGLLIGPFNQPGSVFAPLGISPRDHLIGKDVLGNQFPRRHIPAHPSLLLPQWANCHLPHLATASLHFSLLELPHRLPS